MSLAFGATPKGKSVALVLAAGGEPPGVKTIFDERLLQLRSSLASFDERIALCDLSHASTRGVCNLLATSGQATNFTVADAKAAIAALSNRLRAGGYEKVLVVVETHGYPFQGYFGDKNSSSTHLVSAADRAAFDLDGLIPLRDAAKASGALFGLVDNSCYGANSLALADSNSCVVTAASRNRVGMIWTGDKTAPSLWRAHRPGGSLEEAFLLDRARKEVLPTLPQISTPAGMKVESLLENSVERVLLFVGDDVEIQHHPQLERFFSRKESVTRDNDWAEAAGGATESQRALSAILAKTETQIEPFRQYWDYLITFDQRVENVHNGGVIGVYTWSQLLATPSWAFHRSSEGVLASGRAKEIRASETGKAYLKTQQYIAYSLTRALAPVEDEISRRERKVYSELYSRFAMETAEASVCARFKF